MTYTGDVSVGGAFDVRELSAATIRKASVSEQDNNSYLITCRATGRQLLVDAADNPDTLLRLIATDPAGGAQLQTVVTTHQHFDHHRALAAVAGATGAIVAAGRDDAAGLPVPVDLLLDHGDRIQVGELSLTVVHLRGHTPGSVALVLGQDRTGVDTDREPGTAAGPDDGVHAFTGDSLFPGGPGRTTSAADFTALMDDLEARIFGPLPDRTWIYPGHGRDSTLGAERPQLPAWRARGW